METKWYAIYTKPRWEKKVAETLTYLQIQNYCPLNRILKQWSDRKKMVQEPLFPSYVFVKVATDQLPALRKIDGILSVVSWLGKPAVIQESEIEIIRHFLSEHTNVKLEKTVVNMHDKVKVTSGPLLEKEGTVVQVKNNILQVELPALGYLLYVELERNKVVKISS